MLMLKRVFLVVVALLTVILIPGVVQGASGGPDTWTVDTESDFETGTLSGVDTWSQPGEVILDRRWGLPVQVNDLGVPQSRFQPDITTVISHTSTTTDTLFFTTWADERVQDHNPDIYVAWSANDGRTWSPDVMVSGAHVTGEGKWDPAIAARKADDSLWIVWQYAKGSDAGDIYYGFSTDKGVTWSSNYQLATFSGAQHSPAIVSDEASGYLYAAWEDERGDDGDIFIARYNGSGAGPWQAIRADDGPMSSEQARPALAADSAGNVYLAWEDDRDDPDGYDPHVYFSSWSAGGTWTNGSWSTSIQLSDAASDWATGPALAVGPDDALHAVWVERVGTGPASATYDFQVVVATSNDQGATWSRSVVDRQPGASAVGNASIKNPDVGVDAQGQVHVSWLYYPDQSEATSGEIQTAQSPDGGMAWTERASVTLPVNEAATGADPSLAVAGAGAVVVVWEDYALGSAYQIYAASYPGLRYLPRGEWIGTLDPGVPASWDTLTWTATTPAFTGLELATRVLTATGAQWTPWAPHATSGATLPHPDARYLQVRATLSTTLAGAATPVLDQLSISYTPYTAIYLPLIIR